MLDPPMQALYTFTSVSTSISSTTTNPGRPTAFQELTTTSTIITNNKQSTSQCIAIATTTGVVSAIITALLVAGICIAIHIAVYQCFYKPRLRYSTSTAVGGHEKSHSQMEGVMGSGDAIVYDVVNERPGHGVGTALEMRENEAYSINKRVEEPGMKQNEAYGVVRPN
ncbi:MAG: hypothetical protein MJE68_09830 [Proteobacteria bacterium]|nr:hypothetical protein [Pseudomonadota bacterium]